MLEIGWLSRKALTVLWVDSVLPPPEVGRIGDVRIGGFNGCQGFLSRTDNIGCAAGRSGIFERIAGFTLSRIHANSQSISTHA